MLKATNHKDNLGMTLPEVIVAVLMLAAFTGLFVVVINYTTNFFVSRDRSRDDVRGVLIDHHELLMSMDQLAETLSQPGYKLNEITEITQNCSYPPKPPTKIWGLPGVEKQSLPDGYKICLFPTSLLESSLEDLAAGKADAKPGIYILYASPLADKISLNALPVRRLFCRPKPYC